MMNNSIIKTNDFALPSIVEAILHGSNPNTKQSYKREILAFWDWFKLEGRVLDLPTIERYKEQLILANKSAASINLKLSALRFFFRKAASLNYWPKEKANEVCAISAVKTRGQRIGTWLTKEQLEKLLTQPHEKPFAHTALAYRDQAILAILGGAGLRRSEVSNLKFEQIVLRDNRWVLADIIGKRGVVRSVPIATWIKSIIDQWIEVSGINCGIVFRQCSWKSGESLTVDLIDKALSDETIRNVVKRYSLLANGIEISSRDLRRSFARLARLNGCPIEQIQLSLGHHSIKTTQIYLGNHQDLINAPSDFLHLEIKPKGLAS